MDFIQNLLFASAVYPLYCAWWATRGTSLAHAVVWCIVAWLVWGLVLTRAVHGHPNPAVFSALCLTGCAGVAVLGARRPIVGAWNFVVLGLLAVMALPLIEMTLLGAKSLDGLRIFFLIATLGISILNYVPTCFGPAAFLFGLGCAGELVGVLAPEPLPEGAESILVRLCWLTAPWLALVRSAPDPRLDELDRPWLEFRNGWGVVWGQRVREQFNRSAANAGWPVHLQWWGFCWKTTPDSATRAAVGQTLRGLLTRFVSDPVTIWPRLR